MISDYIEKDRVDMVFFMRPLPLSEFSEIASMDGGCLQKQRTFFLSLTGSVLQNLV